MFLPLTYVGKNIMLIEKYEELQLRHIPRGIGEHLPTLKEEEILFCWIGNFSN